MRDDVRKNLKRMEEQLLVEASLEEEFGDWLKEDEEEEDWLADARELLGDTPPRKPQMFDYEEEEDEEETTVYAPSPKKKIKTKAAKKQKKAKAKKEKGVGGLVFLACLELIGIGAVIVWWLLWLL